MKQDKQDKQEKDVLNFTQFEYQYLREHQSKHGTSSLPSHEDFRRDWDEHKREFESKSRESK